MKKIVFGLAALMLAATSMPAAAEDDEVGRAILRELRLLRKEIQGLRKDLTRHRNAAPRAHAFAAPVPNRLRDYSKQSKQAYKKAMEYYKACLRHGEPNYGGWLGIISQWARVRVMKSKSQSKR